MQDKCTKHACFTVRPIFNVTEVCNLYERTTVSDTKCTLCTIEFELALESNSQFDWLALESNPQFDWFLNPLRLALESNPQYPQFDWLALESNPRFDWISRIQSPFDWLALEANPQFDLFSNPIRLTLESNPQIDSLSNPIPNLSPIRLVGSRIQSPIRLDLESNSQSIPNSIGWLSNPILDSIGS